MQAILEFEKPIEELEVKIAELRNFATEKGIDLTNEIAILENRAREVKESIYSNLNSWQKVLIARHPERPNVYDYIKHLFTQFYELFGDRLTGTIPGSGRIARFRGRAVTVLGHLKGKIPKKIWPGISAWLIPRATARPCA